MKYQIQGHEELKRNMRQFTQEYTEKAISKALGQAGKYLKDEVSAAAPKAAVHKHPGPILKDNIFFAKTRKAGAGRMQFVVGVKYGKSTFTDNKLNRKLKRVGKKYKTEGDTFYWKFFEFGTRKMNKRSFIGPTFRADVEKVLAVITQSLTKAVDNIARKLKK